MIECIKFKSHKKGYLQGFADFYIEKWGVELNGCSLYMKDGRRWLNMPAKEYTNPEGEQKYAPIVRFREKKHFEVFIEQAKKAIDKWCEENQNHSEIPESSFDDDVYDAVYDELHVWMEGVCKDQDCEYCFGRK